MFLHFVYMLFKLEDRSNRDYLILTKGTKVHAVQLPKLSLSLMLYIYIIIPICFNAPKCLMLQQITFPGIKK